MMKALFKVSRWLETQNADPQEVEMIKRGLESWKVLPTSYINSTQTVHNFSATSEGFSTYAITLERTNRVRTNSTSQNQADAQDGRDQDNLTLIPVLILALILLILSIYIYREDVLDRFISGQSERKELEAQMDKLKQNLSTNSFDDQERQKAMMRIQNARSCINQEEYSEAREILSNINENLK